MMNPTAAAQLGIQPFDAADYLQSDEDCAQYLQACIDEAPEDAALFTKAVGDIARARGMMQLARDTGINRINCEHSSARPTCANRYQYRSKLAKESLCFTAHPPDASIAWQVAGRPQRSAAAYALRGRHGLSDAGRGFGDVAGH